MDKRALAKTIQKSIQASTGRAVTLAEVSEVLGAYHDLVFEQLVQGEEFKLGRIGKLIPTHHPGQPGYWTGDMKYIPASAPYMSVRVRLFDSIKKEVRMTKDNDQDTGMEKLGVSTQLEEDGVKLGNDPKYCPICRRPVEVQGGQFVCPEHGTAPFER